MTDEFIRGSQDGMPVDLAGCLVQIEASKVWFTRRVLPLSLEQLRWRPDKKQWSIAECLDHLNLTMSLCLPKIDDAICLGWCEGRTLAGSPRHRPSEIEILKQVEPPVQVQIAAPAALLPAAAVDPDWLVDHFHRVRDWYADAVRRASGLDLPRILIVEPIYPSIHSLGGTLAFMAAHDRRHMWQAERVRNEPRFPQAVFTTWRERQNDPMIQDQRQESL